MKFKSEITGKTYSTNKALKIAEARFGKTWDENVRASMSKSHSGKTMSNEARDAMSLGRCPKVYCIVCKGPVQMHKTVKTVNSKGFPVKKGVCPNCGSSVYRFMKAA